MFIKPKSIFDILNEAEDDDNNDAPAAGGDAPDTGDMDEDFSVDANLKKSDVDNTDNNNDNADQQNTDNEDNAGDTEGGDEDVSADEDEDSGGDDTMSDTSSMSDGESDAEPIKANTDIFSSLTAEEQKLKIGELKKRFAELYSSLDDISEKVSNIDDDIIDVEIVNRIVSAVYKFKSCVAEYITSIYDNKSYVENKIQYMKFLMIINGINSVVEKVSKKKE